MARCCRGHRCHIHAHSNDAELDACCTRADAEGTARTLNDCPYTMLASKNWLSVSRAHQEAP
jgi:hypothetical protein